MAENRVRFPRFFKVFLAETASESLSIPLSFMEELADPLPPTAKLEGTGGRTWKVSLSKIREGAYFTTGWSKFAEEHNLQSGEFLTFVYDGHRTFEVSIFGRSCCKETRAVAEMVELSESEEVEEISMDDADDALAFSDDQEMSDRNSNTDVIANPSFDTNLKSRIYELLIPAQTIYEHNLTFGRTVKYIDAEGITSGERGKWADNRVCFKGWDRICRRNRLKMNDTVTCELLHTRKEVHSIRIHITRGTA
ncbi:unnamed protein product [Arabis nemorensis]|uniref:TF-B3 domain-containing protein n=1 Tax=Arabis nemorensis TaxID=586526 RepID=A0A565BXC6_9BRAS|nr:unnamed protein product [Arabis nemorensis]